MGITFAYELGLKSFLYEKSSTRKVTSEFNGANPVKHFQNPQKPNRKMLRGFQDLERQKNSKKSNSVMAHLPMVRHYSLGPKKSIECTPPTAFSVLKKVKENNGNVKKIK